MNIWRQNAHVIVVPSRPACSNLSHHKKTKKHQKYIEEKNKQEEEDLIGQLTIILKKLEKNT